MCVWTHTHKHREQILAYLGDFYECVFMLFTYAPFWTYIYSSILNTFCQELFRKCKGLDGSISLYLSGVIAYNWIPLLWVTSLLLLGLPRKRCLNAQPSEYPEGISGKQSSHTNRWRTDELRQVGKKERVEQRALPLRTNHQKQKRIN